jgi:2-(3-amino-3-carboxypropyl)histidine synthase
MHGGVPEEILHDRILNELIQKNLPWNYDFEIHKTVWRIKQAQARLVALQFPEGLVMFSCIISDILREFCAVDTVILGDVTYGACCVDDMAARALGCDFMVHYGHSCLIPIEKCEMEMLYVFVQIQIDSKHLIETVKQNLPREYKLALAGTVQFLPAIQDAARELADHFSSLICPQEKPLSKSEVLGCTAPKLAGVDGLVFVADGRFHLESIMIANPLVKAFRYNPYNKDFTVEEYGHEEMKRLRLNAIHQAKQAHCWGLILGGLGRQGNIDILDRIEASLREKGLSVFKLLLSEITQDKLDCFPHVETYGLEFEDLTMSRWVQIACPRLSIDWGYAFKVPLLSPYEAFVALEEIDWKAVYPMDNYSRSGGKWSNYYGMDKKSNTDDNEARVAAKALVKARLKAARGARNQKVAIQYTL